MVGVEPKRTKGFSLVELMIVVAIISILAAIALPSYRSYTLESSRSEGTGELTKIMGLQERFYINQFPPTYTTDLTVLGYIADPVITENGYYSISAVACGTDPADVIASCVRLTATGLDRQDEDGDLRINSRGVKQRLPYGETDWDDGWD